MDSVAVYNQLMLLKGDLVHKCTTTSGRAVTMSIDSCIETFAVNIFLVLQGERLAYRADIPGPMNSVAIEKAVMLTDNRLLVIDGPEPLIVLKSNAKELNRLIQTSPTSEHFLGTVLGYRYIGDDYYIGKRHFVHLNHSGCKSIYSYVVPEKAYTKELLNIIGQDELRLTRALEPLGLGPVNSWAMCVQD